MSPSYARAGQFTANFLAKKRAKKNFRSYPSRNILVRAFTNEPAKQAKDLYLREENGKRMVAIQQKLMSVEEYLEYEITSELRHEYINGQLLEIPGEKKINNRITSFLTVFFLTLLEEKGYNVYNQAIKVTIPNERKFYYPDLLLTSEPEKEGDEYIVYKPELIVEVLSKTSRTHDTINKYLDYIKISSLKYYLIIDPERTSITVHSKDENGEWEADAYSEKTDVILLPLLKTELPLSIIYR